MGANSFLVRYAGGWAERKSVDSINTYGRQEALLGLGALSSIAEVNRVADGQLDDFATPREQTDILIDPRWNGEAPYYGWQVGDTITVQGTSHRVLAVSVTEDGDRVVFVPSLNENVVLRPEERVAQALSKMVRGTMGGRSKVAQPVVPVAVQRGRPNGAEVLTETFNKGTSAAWGPDIDWTMDTRYVADNSATVSNRGTLGGGPMTGFVALGYTPEIEPHGRTSTFAEMEITAWTDWTGGGGSTLIYATTRWDFDTSAGFAVGVGSDSSGNYVTAISWTMDGFGGALDTTPYGHTINVGDVFRVEATGEPEHVTLRVLQNDDVVFSFGDAAVGGPLSTGKRGMLWFTGNDAAAPANFAARASVDNFRTGIF